MARTFSLNWGGFTNGEDSVTDATDPLSIPNGRCSRMENLIPSAGRLVPRDGSRFICETTDLWWMEQYEEATSGSGLLVDSGDLIAVGASGGRQVIKESWLDYPCAISSVRVGKYLVLLPDAEGKALVIWKVGPTFQSIPAYLDNTESPLGMFEAGTGLGDGSVDWSYDQDLTEMPDTQGSWEVGLPRKLTYTWVRLENLDGQEFNLGTGMPAAQLESWEQKEIRADLTYNHLRINGIGSQGLRGKLRVATTGTATPEYATHLRLYMTMPGTISEGNYQNAQDIANGLVLRWVADVPVSSLGGLYEITGGDGALAGSTNLCWATDRDDIPPGGKVLFAGGRLWVSGGQTESNPGRAYFSAIADGSVDQLSRLLSFRYATDFVDTSTDETQPMIGMGLSQGALIFFNTRSVWSLHAANPDYAPECISVSRGAVGGITEIGQRIFYVSQDGPAAVSGGVVDLLSNFKSSYVWPNVPGRSQFFVPGRRIVGWWHSGNWMTSDGQYVACFNLGDDNNSGTWRLSTNVSMEFSCKCHPMKGTVWVGGGGAGVYSLMQPGAVMDGEGSASKAPFTARLITNATPVPKGVVSGEAFSVKTYMKWYDSGSELKISLLGDYGRVSDLYKFEETQEPGAANGHAQIERGPITQPIVQGALSHWFQVGLEKNIWAETLFGPIELKCLARNYDTEGWSMADPGRAEPILDAGMLTWDPETTEI